MSDTMKKLARVSAELANATGAEKKELNDKFWELAADGIAELHLEDPYEPTGIALADQLSKIKFVL